MRSLLTGILAALLLLSTVAHGQTPNGVVVPEETRIVDVDEKMGTPLPLDLTFVSHDGTEVTLRDYFDGTRPVLLTLNYYGCPMLCGLQLNAMTDTLGQLDWVAGENYRIVTVSIDPEEGSELAAAKRQSHLDALGQGDAVDWSFLTGTESNITALAEALGYRYHYVEETGEYAHPAVLMFVSPDGMISRYLYGLSYEARDLKFALLEASEGHVGTTIDRIILACYMYDPDTGSYVKNAFFFMRAGATAGLLALAALLAVLWRVELRKKHQQVA